MAMSTDLDPGEPHLRWWELWDRPAGLSRGLPAVYSRGPRAGWMDPGHRTYLFDVAENRDPVVTFFTTPSTGA